MIGGILAVTAGIVALLGLTGTRTVPRTWMRTVLAGLPVVAVSGAHFAPGGWTLPIALGMTVSVVLGMVASLIGPAHLPLPDGHWVAQTWRAASVLLVGIVLGSVLIRWGVSLMAPIPLISPRALAVVLALAAVAAAYRGGALRGLVSTGTVILLILFVLTLAAGALAGTPSTLTSPLVDVSHPAGAWALFLIVFVLAAANPALRQIRAEGHSIVPGTIILGVVTLLGLVALLAFNGGYLKLPSFGMATVAGYAGFRSPLPGAVLCTLMALVVLASAVLLYRSVFTTHRSFHGVGDDEPTIGASWWQSGWFSAVVLGILAIVLAVPWVPLEPVLWVAALFVLSGWVAVWWMGRRGSAENESSEGIDPVAAGQGPSA